MVRPEVCDMLARLPLQRPSTGSCYMKDITRVSRNRATSSKRRCANAGRGPLFPSAARRSSVGLADRRPACGVAASPIDVALQWRTVAFRLARNRRWYRRGPVTRMLTSCSPSGTPLQLRRSRPAVAFSCYRSCVRIERCRHGAPVRMRASSEVVRGSKRFWRLWSPRSSVHDR